MKIYIFVMISSWVSNLRYADDTTLMADSEEELKSFLMNWEYQTTSPASWEICMQVKMQQLEMDKEHQTVSI